jgi:hypothetical protein
MRCTLLLQPCVFKLQQMLLVAELLNAESKVAVESVQVQYLCKVMAQCHVRNGACLQLERGDIWLDFK